MLNVSLETMFKNRFKIVNLNKLEVDESKDVLEKVASLDSIFILKMAKIFRQFINVTTVTAWHQKIFFVVLMLCVIKFMHFFLSVGFKEWSNLCAP